MISYEKEYTNIFDELKDRGYLDNTTDEKAVREMLETPGQRFYIGFDPTADSLTVGHFIQIMVMLRMQAYGHVPIALLGGGTTRIGDPTGRSDMRKVLSDEQIDHNADQFRKQICRFLDVDQKQVFIMNNQDWLLNLEFLPFMREVGIHFNVGEMVKKDAYRNRLEAGGLTFFEFAYMLLQSYDFLELYRRLGCRLELGGSDQWANIIGGVELVRKAEGKDVYGMTFRLLTTADGVKMGKSMKGAVWLDEEKTSPYDLFQYLRNVDDRDVSKFLLLLTFLPKAECLKLGGYTDERINEGKEVLAYEVTKLVHGKEKADEAREAAHALFAKGADHENMPSVSLAFDGDSIGLLDLCTQSGLTKSNGEARRLIQQGGLRINDEKVTDIQQTIPAQALEDGLTLKKGKKIYLRVTKK